MGSQMSRQEMGSAHSVISEKKTMKSCTKSEMYCQHDQSDEYQADEYKITYKRDCLILITTTKTNLSGQVVEDQSAKIFVDKMLPELKSTLKDLGFIVHTLVGQITKKMAADKISEILRYQNDTDMFLMYMSGHGRADGFGFSDGTVPISRLTEPIKDCTQLKDKPKLFFISTCRSCSQYEPQSTSQYSERGHPDNDTLYLWSCPPNELSYLWSSPPNELSLDSEKVYHFPEYLINELKKYKSQSLRQMVTKIHKSMSNTQRTIQGTTKLQKRKKRFQHRKNIRLASYENGQLSKELYFSRKMCHSPSCTMRQHIPSLNTTYKTNQPSTDSEDCIIVSSENQSSGSALRRKRKFLGDSNENPMKLRKRN
jgi:hypothetical protein